MPTKLAAATSIVVIFLLGCPGSGPGPAPAATKPPPPVEDQLGLLRRSAEGGDVKAMVQLAIHLGEDPEGVTWLRKAAEQGDRLGMSWLGSAYNDHFELDRREMIRWFRKAAAAGDPFAQSRLFAWGVEKGGFKAAIPWLEKAAAANDSRACYFLGKYAANGNGRPKDLVASERWYRKGAELGHSNCMEAMGDLLKQRQLGRAMKWWRRGAKLGNSGCMASMGWQRLHGRGQHPAKGIEWLQRAVVAFPLHGRAMAHRLLANCHEQGTGDLEADEVEAFQHYRLGGMRGDSYALFKVGVYYEEGRGGQDIDPYLALRAYRVSVHEGREQTKERIKSLLEAHPYLEEIRWHPPMADW